jgi:beta propeller repeat protein
LASGISPGDDSQAAINNATAPGGATMKSLTHKEESKIKNKISKLRNHRFAMMNSSILIFLTCLFFLFGMLTTDFVIAGESWKEFAIHPTTDDQEAPDIDGDIVVWQQFVEEYQDYDIYVADMNNPDDPLALIIGDANDQMSPVVFENTVVWQDYIISGGSGDWDIRASDISDRQQPVMFAVSNIFDNDEQAPAIHGNIVVWQDGDEGNYNIFGADITDLESPAEFAVAGFDHDQWRPAVYRTTVVWQDSYFGDQDILAADIWQRNKPTDFGVSLAEFDQQRPAIWGDIVVWEDNYFVDMDIYAADISDPNNPVEFAIVANEAEQTNPDIDRNIVVWQDNRNGDWDIYGYNLTTRLEFQITDEPHDQTNPAVSGNTVVWEDSREGNLQIFAIVLDGPEVARCTSKLTGDINGDCKVDFDDQAIMLSQWLECNLEPEEACGQ